MQHPNITFGCGDGRQITIQQTDEGADIRLGNTDPDSTTKFFSANDAGTLHTLACYLAEVAQRVRQQEQAKREANL
jgi:hypothetical protein